VDVTVERAPASYDAFRAQVRAFVAEHAPPPPEVARAGMRTPDTQAEVDALKAWLRALADSGFSPRTLDDPWQRSVALEELDAAGAPTTIGNALVESALATHGTEEQKQRLLPGIRSGQEIWCQLFSEPNAGSDMAGLQTRAVRDGDHYRINGQKVWTTWGQWSDYGYLLARTDPDAERHAGITAFVIDMRQPGVEVRPLREITGTSDFNEVFFTDALVPVSNVIAGEGQGWRIATTSLATERSHQRGTDRILTEQVRDLIEMRPTAAHELTRLYERAHVLALLEHRVESKEQAGSAGPADAAVLKMTFSTLNLAVAEEALALLDSAALLEDGDPRSVERGRWQDMFLYARAYTISAGSNEIMRNMISERGLGMPRP
jgi:alkylation response protein AidB-like acyl-CoA dehydrogenase